MYNICIIIILIIIIIYNYIFFINYNKILSYKHISNNKLNEKLLKIVRPENNEKSLEKIKLNNNKLNEKLLEIVRHENNEKSLEKININNYKYIYSIPKEEYNKPPERLINYPTRGFPSNYELYGIVIRNNTETIYNLYGRQKYPGSSQYEYYIEGKGNNNTNVKIPLNIRGDKELEDETYIEIPGLDRQGLYQVKLYKMELPRYIPYI